MVKMTLTVANYDVYENGRIKLSSIQKYMQRLAGEDCDRYGATYAALRADNMVFVITRLAIEFTGDIFFGDTITVTTCSDRIEGVTFVREFKVEKDGVTVCTAATDWVLMDFIARKVLRPSAMRYPIAEERLGFSRIDVKRRIAPADLPKIAEHTVRYTELDENRHLNNAVYADILFDDLPGGVPDHRIRECRINFEGEAKLGAVLAISARRDGGIYTMSARNITAGNSCFEAELAFEEGDA